MITILQALSANLHNANTTTTMFESLECEEKGLPVVELSPSSLCINLIHTQCSIKGERYWFDFPIVQF